MKENQRKNREYSQEYLNMQHGAMRWLAEIGLTIYEIQQFSFGNVDELERTMRVRRPVYSALYNRETGILDAQVSEKFVQISLKETEYAWFFLKSKLPCTYFFTKERPRSWRKGIAKESLYSLLEVKKIIGRSKSKESTNALTITNFLDNMDLSKLNITKLEENVVSMDLERNREAEEQIALN